jgi:beta-phosphoglucomutase-like phosphatase (HAD superfamily)
MKYVRVALDVLGLAPYFQTVMSCADIGVGKDVPDIYLMARDALGFSENEICVYEDSFVAIETARAAGFRTVGIYDRYNYNQERLRASSDIYIGIDDKISDLIEKTKLLGE